MGRRSREDIGPDWCGLFIGNEGLFGIALEITLQLLPKPECFHTVLAGYRTPGAGRATRCRAVVASRACCPARSRSWTRWPSRPPWPRSTPSIRPAARPSSSSNSKATREAVAADRVRLDADHRGSRAPYEMRVAPDDADERLRIWKGRKSAFCAVGRLSPGLHRAGRRGAAAPARRGPAPRSARWRARPACACANVFHAGDGNLHPLILYDGREPGALERAEALAGRHPAACASRWAARSPASTASASRSATTCPRCSTPTRCDCMRRLRAGLRSAVHRQPRQDVPRAGEAPALQHRGLHPLEKAGVISRE